MHKYLSITLPLQTLQRNNRTQIWLASEQSAVKPTHSLSLCKRTDFSQAVQGRTSTASSMTKCHQMEKVATLTENQHKTT